MGSRGCWSAPRPRPRSSADCPEPAPATYFGKVLGVASVASTSTNATVACLSASGSAAMMASIAPGPASLSLAMAFCVSGAHQIRGRLDLLDQPVGTQVGEKTHSAVLMLLYGLPLPQPCAHNFQWPGSSKQAWIMPCLPGATAVLACSRVTVSMAISEASVRAALESFVEPVSAADPGSKRMRCAAWSCRPTGSWQELNSVSRPWAIRIRCNRRCSSIWLRPVLDVELTLELGSQHCASRGAA